MKIFKVEAEGDVTYIQANTWNDAKRKLFKFTGPIPDDLLSYAEVEEVPDGEELL